MQAWITILIIPTVTAMSCKRIALSDAEVTFVKTSVGVVLGCLRPWCFVLAVKCIPYNLWMILHKVTAKNPVTFHGDTYCCARCRGCRALEILVTVNANGAIWKSTYCISEAFTGIAFISNYFWKLSRSLTANQGNCLAFKYPWFVCALSNIWCRLNIDFYTFWNTVKNVP